MAAPMKRKFEPAGEKLLPEWSPLKKANVQNLDPKLDTFLTWCRDNDFNISDRVQVGKEGSCAHYGMVAVQNIPEGYCLFQIPRSCLLMPQNSEIGNIILQEKDKLCAANQWIPLLLTLLFEKNNPSSKWKPYLDLFPNYTALDLPIFWTRLDVDTYLKGTGVDQAVDRDLEMIKNDFDTLVLPFFKKHSDYRSALKDLDFFKRLVAFVMAYSFNEPKNSSSKNGPKNSESNNEDDDELEEEEGEEEEVEMQPPVMAPLADALNHVTKNNAKLTFGKKALKMVATRHIEKGEEIFNTYGQVSNLHLMHMYGFAEMFPTNSNDVVEIPTKRLFTAASQTLDTDQVVLQAKWDFLEEQDIVDDDDMTILGTEGIVTDDTCVPILKVLCMSESEFKEHLEKEGWSDAESDSSLSGESRLSFEKIGTCDDKWRDLLQRMADAHLAEYDHSLEEDEKKLQQQSELSKREKFALFLAHGQKKLLWKLKQACNTRNK